MQRPGSTIVTKNPAPDQEPAKAKAGSMQFDLDLGIQIAAHLQDQDTVLARIDPEDIPLQSDDEERWKSSERLEAHLLLMQDAGWLDNVDMFNARGTWQARLTYQGHLWLDASSNEGMMERIKQGIQNQGMSATNTVVAEVIKAIVSTTAT